MKLIDIPSEIWKFAFTKDELVMTDLSEAEYKKLFLDSKDTEKVKASYEKAWQAKNFEIDNYWKRANYFWAFQVASFAGYFSVLGSKASIENPEVIFFIVCIGIITSLAWVFINNGSKTWQRHWEMHVDMLEDEITGPLYKIVTAPKTYSVSKINDIVSRFFATIWILLSIKYFEDHITFYYSKFENINWKILGCSLLTLYFICSMIYGYGRGRFGERKVQFYKRKFIITTISSEKQATAAKPVT